MGKNETARLLTVDGEPVMLEGVKAAGELRGALLEMTVEQVFRNPTDRNVEVVYTFPLPWGAVLLGVDVLLGDRHLTGAVVPKKEAEAEYEEALSAGNAAVMLENNQDESYSLNLGNLAVGEASAVTIRYAEILRFEQGGLRLMIPTVIAPRYGDPVRDGGLRPHQVPTYSPTAEYPFEISVRLHGDLARARVASPSHPVSVAATDGMLIVSLARRGALDRDFVLVVDRLAHDSMAILARDSVSTDRFVALVSFRPNVPAGASTAVAVKLLVDCSGSMAGDSIDAAKRALHAVVRQFAEGDRFSLSRFGSSVEHRSRGLWSATEATRHAAERWVGALEADLGGTEMARALESSFGLAQTVSSDVLIVTDGDIDAIDRTIAAAKQSGHRLFIVGVGSSPAESHLHRLAEATGGSCDFVAPGEAVEPAVLRMFVRLRSPRVTDLRVAWPEQTPPIWESPLNSAIFDGDTVTAFALFSRPLGGSACLLGARAPGAVAEEIARATFDRELVAEDTVARTAAASRIRSLAVGSAEGAMRERQEFAVSYRLVTAETNFLLIHEREVGEKPTDMPELHKVRPVVAAGWGGMGSVLKSLSDIAEGCLNAAPASSYLERERLRDDFDDFAPAVVRRAFGKRDPGIRFSTRADADFDFDDVDRIVADIEQAFTPIANASMALDRVAKVAKYQEAIRRSSARYWSDSGPYVGLTPLGLCEWLKYAPKADWPRTYDELSAMGLGASVVDWLKQVAATSGSAQLGEQLVVASFIALFALPVARTSLLRSLVLGNLPTFRTKPKKSRGRKEPRSAQHEQLMQRIVQLLHGITPATWPDTVFPKTTTP